MFKENNMNNNFNTVLFAFFIILATTLNFGFFWGDISNPDHHPIIELFIAIIINLIALTLKFGNKTEIDSIQLATSGVSCFQLVIAGLLWFYAISNDSMDLMLPSIVSLSGGALIANFYSMILLTVDSVISKR
jgi:hypothetical protein